MPSESQFKAWRPKKQTRFESTNDRSVCTKHFNYEQMINAFNDKVVGNHLYTSRFCTQYAQCNVDNKCQCATCINCRLIKGTFEGDLDKLMHKILCENGKRWPHLECINGKCGKRVCGMNLLKGILSRRLCPSFFIRPEALISYDAIELVKDTCDRKHHQIVNHTVTWAEFKDKLMYTVLPEFILHSSAY